MIEDATRLIVRGIVQGVGFRWFVREHARRLGCRGWVANRPDGSVEIVAAGPPEALAELRRVVADGPTGAQVTGVDSAPAAIEEPLAPGARFEIKRGK